MVFFHRIRRFGAAALALLLICALAVPGPAAKADAPASYSAALTLEREEQSIQVKLWADVDNSLFGLQAKMPGEDSEDMGLFLGKSALVFQNLPLLDGTYGIDLEHLTENLPGSVFAPDSGSALALDQALYDALMAQDDTSLGIIGGADGPTSILVAGGLGGTLQSLLPMLAKNASLKLTPGELVLESGTIKTTKTTVTFDPEGIAGLAEQAFAGLDPETQASLVQVILSLLGTGEEATESEDAMAALQEALVRADAHLTFSISMVRKSKQVVAVDAALSWDENTAALRAVFTGEVYSLTLEPASGAPLCAALTLDEDSDSALNLRFVITQGDTPTSQITFRWDKTAGAYVLTTQSGDRTDELTGTIQGEEDTIIITADTANGQTLGETSLTLCRVDPVSLPEFRDIITMEESEILQVLQTAVSSILALPEAVS